MYNKKLVVLGVLLLVVSFSLPGFAESLKPQTIKLDYAYYNPLSLVLKSKGILENDLGKENIKVEWVFSLGSNKSLEYLNSKSTDFGSTAGAAALISKANGNPIKTVYVFSKPEWTALLVGKDSKITNIKELKGKSIAVTRGTDPYVFLVRSLEKAGLSIKDVEIVSLQHPDGKNALIRGQVDAWSGLDPLMAQAEIDNGAKIIYRNPDFNTYGVLNVREEFAKNYPQYVEKVIAAYEKARKWALQNPDELKKILLTEAKLDDAVAVRVLKRTSFNDPLIGETQKKTISAAGSVLKKSGVIQDSSDVDKILNDLIDPQYAKRVIK